MNVETLELKKALSTLNSVIGAHSPSEAMRGVLIDGSTSDGLYLVGTNGETTIKTKVEGETSTDGETLLLPYSYLKDIVSKADAPEVEIKFTGNIAHISSGKSKFKLNVLRKEDFPNISFEEDGNEFQMECGELLSIIDKTIFATSTKDYGRQILKGVNVATSKDDKTLRFVATDSYRLSLIEKPFKECEFNVTIPGEALKMLKGVFGNTEKINVSVSDKHVIFKSENSILKSTVCAGSYPDIDRLIPYNFQTVVTLNRAELINCLNRGSMFKNDNISVVKMDIKEGNITVSSKNAELGEFNETVNADVEGEDLVLSFSASYVLDALKALSTDEVKLNFQGNMKPFTLVNVNDSNSKKDTTILELALPVKTYN